MQAKQADAEEHRKIAESVGVIRRCFEWVFTVTISAAIGVVILVVIWVIF